MSMNQVVLLDLANAPLRPGTFHQRQMEALLRYYQKTGFTLAQCADPKHLNRTVGTLKDYAKRFSLAFPDYVPTELRPPKPVKTKRPTEVK